MKGETEKWIEMLPSFSSYILISVYEHMVMETKGCTFNTVWVNVLRTKPSTQKFQADLPEMYFSSIAALTSQVQFVFLLLKNL